MDELLGEVLHLQQSWTASSSPEMERRGVIIRREIPAWLKERLPVLAEASGIEDLAVQGRDAMGRKSVIPWVRLYSKQESPSATGGWYLVYLFSAGGDRVYLSLIQGSMRWDGENLGRRNPQELITRASWARERLSSQIAERADLVSQIRLESTRGRIRDGYENGTVVALAYKREDLPHESDLESDLLFMVRLLSALHHADQAATYVPGDTIPEIVEATEAATGQRNRATGQGRGLSPSERKVVELRAVHLATEYFTKDGWAVKDVGATESFDLLLSRVGQKLHVEVKGTTSLGQQIVLTRAEVEAQRTHYPNNALVIVHSIELDRVSTPPTASAGVLECVSPWSIQEDALQVISYTCRTGL